MRARAAFLRDVPAAWDAVSAEQRNTLARTLFQSVDIDDGRVITVLPEADFAPFFNMAEAGATGHEEGQPGDGCP